MGGLVGVFLENVRPLLTSKTVWLRGRWVFQDGLLGGSGGRDDVAETESGAVPPGIGTLGDLGLDVLEGVGGVPPGISTFGPSV